MKRVQRRRELLPWFCLLVRIVCCHSVVMAPVSVGRRGTRSEQFRDIAQATLLVRSSSHTKTSSNLMCSVLVATVATRRACHPSQQIVLDYSSTTIFGSVLVAKPPKKNQPQQPKKRETIQHDMSAYPLFV